MGVPTAPAYIIAAMIAAPALVHFGMQQAVAHMFVFYSSLLSAITPPVALAAYAGAAIAGANVMRTGLNACKLGFITFLVPYMFAYNSALLAIGPLPFVIWSFVTAILGTVAVATGLAGYLFTFIPNWRRPIYLGAGVLCLIPEMTTDIIGLAFTVFLIWLNHRKFQEEKQVGTQQMTAQP
jgi:TRAP-type uncharacterized transport system fused permease subunit